MQSYAIFNKNNKVLFVKSLSEVEKKSDSQIIHCDSDNLKTFDFFSWFNDNDKEDKVILLENLEIETVFNQISTKIKNVEAAGGIVFNEDKDILFMFRNGYWDLPKGHKELGEDIAFTAKREVLEECGMKNLTQYEYLASSYHSYNLLGKREIKHTSWYRMFCSKNETLKPQVEEGINELCWISKSQLNDVLPKTYPSIQRLFKQILPILNL